MKWYQIFEFMKIVKPVLRGHLCTVKPVLRGQLCTVKPVLRGQQGKSYFLIKVTA